MTINDLIQAMQKIAPLEYAESWDRVGLLVGDRARPLDGPVFLTIDLTERVLDEARAARASAILAYHPPIWEPLPRLTSDSPRQRVLLRAVESGMAVFCPHTALDAAAGGITDWLCEGLSSGTPGPNGTVGRIAGDCRALTPHDSLDPAQEVKIVTFVPASAVDKVRAGLASAGAGLIGNYSLCSFAVEGTGTFLPGEGSNPTIGERGRIEHAHEMRLEMVCASRALPLALATLRQFHPYEEPAIDVYKLLAQPKRNVGPGRRLMLDRPSTLAQLAARLKTYLGHARIQVASVGGPDDLSRQVSLLAVVPGAGAKLAPLAQAEMCEVFITGEMKHHDVLECLHNGMSVILAGHTNTERGYLPRLAARLSSMLPGLRAVVSTADRDPLVIV